LKGSALESEAAARGVKFQVVDFNYRCRSLWRSNRYYSAILRELGPSDIVHLHTTHDILRVAFAFWHLRRPRRARPKLIQQNHIWISHSKRDPLHWVSYSVLDEIWCSSEMAKRDLERFLPVPRERIQVIRYGRDLALEAQWLPRNEARTGLDLPLSALIIGAIARIDRGKGVAELINGALSLLKRDSSAWLVIIGGATLSDPHSVHYANELNARVERLNQELNGRIRMTGALQNAGRYLRAFDVYAQVAYKETFSLALLDAQLAQLPVVGTNSGGTPDIVIEGTTGWLAEPESAVAIESALERAIRDRSAWPEFGARARVRVINEFDFETVARGILERYSKLTRI
jgi:glycosyltransferase involved in cell wall biosynthesis